MNVLFYVHLSKAAESKTKWSCLPSVWHIPPRNKRKTSNRIPFNSISVPRWMSSNDFCHQKMARHSFSLKTIENLRAILKQSVIMENLIANTSTKNNPFVRLRSNCNALLCTHWINKSSFWTFCTQPEEIILKWERHCTCERVREILLYKMPAPATKTITINYF